MERATPEVESLAEAAHAVWTRQRGLGTGWAEIRECYPKVYAHWCNWVMTNEVTPRNVEQKAQAIADAPPVRALKKKRA